MSDQELEAQILAILENGSNRENLAIRLASFVRKKLGERLFMSSPDTQIWLHESIRLREQSAQAAALEAAARSIEKRAADWAGPDNPNATAASIDIRAELLNEAITVRALITSDQRSALQAALDAARLPLIEALQTVIETSEDYARINNLSGSPVWANVAREALERVRASRETP